MRHTISILCLVAFLPIATFAADANVAGIELSGSLTEKAASPGLFGELEETMTQMVRRLDRAAGDSEIKGVLLKIRSPDIGRGKIEEIRAAIARVQAKGKPVVAQLQTAMPADYMVASACDKIIMPESGVLAITGVRAEIMYYKNLFDKIGIQADMLQVGDFKGANEPYTRSSMSPEFRKQFSTVIDDFYNQMVDTIAEDRNLKTNQVKAAIDIGLLTPAKAKELGLIDEVAYADSIDNVLSAEIGADEIAMKNDYGEQSIDTDFSGPMGMIKLFQMLLGEDAAPAASSRKKIAVVFATGPIMTGKSTTSLFGLSTVGSETIIKALRKANDDKSVVAIVLRVDSPGGSALASDLMWREIEQIKKPVYASMGDTAASGGYYISMGCDKIYAEPGTLTGSIGVVGGKMALKGAYNLVGVNSESISRGKNANIFSISSRFSDSERDAFKGYMLETYDTFTSKAAKGRGMKKADLEKLAGGRLWSGRMAKDVGLVDEVGTLRDTLLAAKKAAGLAENDKAEIMYLPKATSIFDDLLGVPSADTKLGEAAEAVLPGAKTRLHELSVLRKILSEPGAVMMPFVVKIR